MWVPPRAFMVAIWLAICAWEVTRVTRDENGDDTPVDLDIYDTIKAYVRQPDGTTLIIRDATIVDASNGRFDIVWEAGDLVEGTSLAELEFVTVAGSKTETLPNSDPLKFLIRGRV